MSIRCAVCGSKRVVTETKKEGYNIKKGIVGGILFGTTGSIIGGTNGNEVTYYHCADCGHTINKCMYDWETDEIDTAINNKDSLYYLNILRDKKKKYPNIEWDEKIEKKQDANIQITVSEPKEKKLDIDIIIKDNDFLEGMIFDVIEQSGTSISVLQLVTIPEFSKYSKQKLADTLRKMVEKKFLNSEIRNNHKCFSLVPNVNKPTREDFPIVEEKKYELSDKDKKIIEFMKDEKKRTLLEIINNFSDETFQRMGVYLKRLVDNGYLLKTKIDNQLYYEINKDTN